MALIFPEEFQKQERKQISENKFFAFSKELTVQEEKEYLSKPETYKYLNDFHKKLLSDSNVSLNSKNKIIFSYIIQQDRLSEKEEYGLVDDEITTNIESVMASTIEDCAKEVEIFNSIKEKIRRTQPNISNKSLDSVTVADHYFRFYKEQKVDPTFSTMFYSRAFEIEIYNLLKRHKINVKKKIPLLEI